VVLCHQLFTPRLGVLLRTQYAGSIELFRVPPSQRLRLRDDNPRWIQTKELQELGKDVVKARGGVLSTCQMA
jgi:hypothetical protein